ncbi:sugar ABC transporter permease [Anaeromicropila herbilytica]|uniref:Sugar ABC transporter permease n=1 Tax=Anaeromicropila herbilytica TaxID=2785025 RepID=A0A7R7EQ26_9FIRM|nr:sugar ABC transporter permease [Anaeromicropila herbilytica]BCN32645.1 sugar ABC transporter permease [Anaeromicropila herbilytica]
MWKRRLKVILVNAELMLVTILVLIPVIWIVMSSFNKGQNLSTASFIPKELTLENYTKLFQETDFGNWFVNSLFIALLNATISVVLILVTAWILSRFKFKGKKTGLLTLLVLSMFPSFLSMTAVYTLYVVFNLVNQPLALVILYAAGAIPYNVWLVKGYIDGIPSSLDEAAYIDGSSRINTFLKIIVPMSKPIIVYCAVSQFMMPWMDYIIPNLLLTGNKNKTVAVGLYSMISNDQNANFTLFAAGAVLVAVPITIMYLLFQKFLVQGIVAGASKE